MKKVCSVLLLYDGKVPMYCKSKGCDGSEDVANKMRFFCFSPISEDVIKILFKKDKKGGDEICSKEKQ